MKSRAFLILQNRNCPPHQTVLPFHPLTVTCRCPLFLWLLSGSQKTTACHLVIWQSFAFEKFSSKVSRFLSLKRREIQLKPVATLCSWINVGSHLPKVEAPTFLCNGIGKLLSHLRIAVVCDNGLCLILRGHLLRILRGHLTHAVGGRKHPLFRLKRRDEYQCARTHRDRDVDRIPAVDFQFQVQSCVVFES